MIIVIVDTVYRVTQKQLKDIREKEKEIESKGEYHGSDVDMDDYLESMKSKFKNLGRIHYHFNLQNMAILLRYEDQLMHFFGDGEWEQSVNLYLEKSYFFGLRKKEVKKVYRISMFQNLKSHYDHWDMLIKTKSQIKLQNMAHYNSIAKGKIIKQSSFTPTNKNHITIEFLGQENKIGNHFKTGYDVEVIITPKLQN